MQLLKWKDEAEWKNLRRQGIGGSDAAAVLGFSPWRTPYDVYAEKVLGVEPEAKNPEALKYGKYAEKYVADTYAERTGYAVENFNSTIADGCLHGNVDRLVNTSGKRPSHKSEIRADVILECKTTNDYNWDAVPLFYQAQVQHYLGLVPEAHRADVAVLYKPTGITQIFQVERDDDTIHDMQIYLRDWWKKHVEGNVAPPPICEADVKKIWKQSNPGKSITADDRIYDLSVKLHDVRQQKKELDAEEKNYIDLIACYMGDASTLLNTSGRTILTYKTYKDRANLDKDALIKDLAEKAGLSSPDLENLKLNFTHYTPGIRPMTFPRKKED